MTAPPGAAAPHGPRRSLVQRETGGDDARRDEGRLVDAYLGQAYATGVAADMGVSHTKLVRLVRAFVATQRSSEEFLGWVVSYADPTGETATWNVLKGRAGWSS